MNIKEVYEAPFFELLELYQVEAEEESGEEASLLNAFPQ